MYELLVLSLLMHWPLHAYRIAKIANEIIGPEDQISTGTLSTLLSKLAQTGLITPADPGMTPFASDRPSRVFALTSAGRERFFALMLDTASHPGNYRRLFHIKALHLEFLPPASQVFLVEHYIAYCQQFLHSKQVDAQDMSDHPLKQEHMQSVFRERALALIRLKIEEWRLELAWVQSLRAQTISRLKQSAEGISEDKNSHLLE
jgi:DNA-binding PadR family transcriptional regulator